MPFAASRIKTSGKKSKKGRGPNRFSFSQASHVVASYGLRVLSCLLLTARLRQITTWNSNVVRLYVASTVHEGSTSHGRFNNG